MRFIKKKKYEDLTEEQKQQLKLHGVDELDGELRDFNIGDAPHGTILTAQELYLIEQAGYQVLNVVFGNIVFSMGIKGLFRSVTRALQRGEMIEFTHMNNDARQIVRNRLLEAAREIGATDVVGIVIETHEWADFIELTATGTAIRKVRKALTPEESLVPVVMSS